MPIVPLRSVRPTAEPSRVEVPRVAQIAGAIGATAEGLAAFAHERDRLDDIRVQEAEVQYRTEIAELFQGEDGLLTKRGTQAAEAWDGVTDGLRTRGSAAEATLSTDRQRTLFARRREALSQDAEGRARLYVDGEIRRTHTEQFNALNAMDLDRVSANPDVAETAIREADERVALYGQSTGTDGAEITRQRHAMRSGLRAAQLTALANTENPEAIARAQELFAREQGTMTERDRQIVERQLELATKAVQEADQGRVIQQTATKILEATTSPTERNEMIAALPIELRKGVRDLVRAEQTAAKEARELEQETAFSNLEAAVQRGVPLTDPRLASDVVKISTTQRQTLERYTMAPTNDNKAWLEFYEMSPADIAKLSESQFRAQWSQLSVAHRDDAERMRKEATSESTGPDGVRGYVTPQERIARAMREVAGLSPFQPMTQAGETEQEAAVRFQNAADLALRQLPEAKRRDPEEIQATLDRLRLDTFRTVQTELRNPLSMAIGRSPFRTREVTQPLFEFSGDAFSRGIAAGVTTFPVERIVDADRQRIRNILTGNGLAGTDRQIEQYYTAEVFGGDVNALLARFRGR